MVLLAPKGKVPKDRSWKAAKIIMAKIDGFLDSLINYDKENIHPEIIKAIQPYLKNPEFEPDFVRSKSGAAAGLCAWVINIIKFYEVCFMYELAFMKSSEQLRESFKKFHEIIFLLRSTVTLSQRDALLKLLMPVNFKNVNDIPIFAWLILNFLELAAAQDKLLVITQKVVSLEEQLAKLTADFEKATADKVRCQQEADATQATIQLANRLVGGLASENVRWAEAVAEYD